MDYEEEILRLNDYISTLESDQDKLKKRIDNLVEKINDIIELNGLEFPA